MIKGKYVDRSNKNNKKVKQNDDEKRNETWNAFKRKKEKTAIKMKLVKIKLMEEEKEQNLRKNNYWRKTKTNIK